MKIEIRILDKNGYRLEPTRIDWTHYKEDGVSFCHLYRIDLDGQKEGLDWGIAFCNPKDVFNRETGRKVSFGDLLENLQLPREERRRLWKEYAIQTCKPWASQFSTSKKTLSPVPSAG